MDPRAIVEAEVARERERRIAMARIRRSFAAWCEFGPPTERGPVRLQRWQLHLAGELQRISRLAAQGKSLRVIIDAPPQSGKSEMVSRRLPVWHMASHGQSVGIGSYSHDLAVEHSIGAREIARSRQARELWPHLARATTAAERDEDSQTLRDRDDDWSIPSHTPDKRNPRFVARGIGGGLSGRSLSLFIPDDLFKDQNEYNSLARRDTVWRWYASQVEARLQEHGGVCILTGTRWGVDDAHERLRRICGDGGVPVEVWSYPLRAGDNDFMGRAPGEYLTDRWTPEKEAQARVMYGSRLAAAILDGKPTPDEGALWQRRWLENLFPGDPATVAWSCDYTMLALDGAATAGGGDWSVLTWWGVMGGKALKLDQWREQLGYPELRALVARKIAQCRPAGTVIEDASAGRQVVQDLQQSIPGIIAIPVSKAKGVRYRSVLPLWEAGSVLLPALAPWRGDYTERIIVLTGEGDEIDDEADSDTLFLSWWKDRAAVAAVGSALDTVAETLEHGLWM